MSKQFIVILPTGKRHEIPPGLFDYYVKMHLLTVKPKQPRIARLSKWIRAFPQEDGSLRFEIVSERIDTTDPYALKAVESLWRRIMSMSRCYEPNEHDQEWRFYDKMVPV